MGSRLACIIFQGGTDRPEIFFRSEQKGVHYFDSKESTSNLVPRDLHPPSTMFLVLIFWISQGLSYQIKNWIRRWAKIFWSEIWSWVFRKKECTPICSDRKKSAPLSVPSQKECRPICSALKNDAGQPGPHLYIHVLSIDVLWFSVRLNVYSTFIFSHANH